MHGKHAREADATAPGTTAMQRGTATHALIFNTRKVCGYPGTARRGKEFDAFAADHADYEILTMAEYDKARRMADAVRAHTTAMSVLTGVFEETIRFEWNDLSCRATPDCRGPSYITELKTSASSDPERFPWHATKKFAYHAQMAMQRIACEEAHGAYFEDCYVVAVESAEPFPVTVFRFTDEALEQGERLLMDWSEKLKAAESSRNWPPYVDCIVPIDATPEDEPMFVEEESNA